MPNESNRHCIIPLSTKRSYIIQIFNPQAPFRIFYKTSITTFIVSTCSLREDYNLLKSQQLATFTFDSFICNSRLFLKHIPINYSL